MAAPIAYRDIGADIGPLQHIWIGEDGSFQIRHVTDTDYQVYPPTSIPGDSGTFLAYGYLYSPRFAQHPSTGVPDLGEQLWDMHSQSMVSTVNGVSRVVTQLQTLGDDITITQVDTYVHGQDCWRTDVIVQNDYIAAASVTLYRVLNTYLHGSDGGYGVELAGGVVGVAANAGNNPPGPVIWLVPLVNDQYFEGDTADLFDLLETSPTPFPNTVDAGGTTDAAVGLAWALTIPAKSVVVRSCLTQVVIPAPSVPPAVDAWHFRGFCYRGANGNTGTPLGGVTMKLYADASNPPLTLRRQTVSDAGGFFNFYEDQDYGNYLVEAVNPTGMAATGSATGDGTVVSSTKVKWVAPARGVHDGNQFFKE